MRLRNIPGAGEVIDNSPYCIKEPVELKGKWHDFLGEKINNRGRESVLIMNLYKSKNYKIKNYEQKGIIHEKEKNSNNIIGSMFAVRKCLSSECGKY